MFNFDTEVSHENTSDITKSSIRQSEVSLNNCMYQWAKFSALNSEFKIEKQFIVKDCDNKHPGHLSVFAKMSKCEKAGLLITFYVKNVIINNTDQRLTFYY
jgi:hypothetical protein